MSQDSTLQAEAVAAALMEELKALGMCSRSGCSHRLLLRSSRPSAGRRSRPGSSSTDGGWTSALATWDGETVNLVEQPVSAVDLAGARVMLLVVESPHTSCTCER